MSYIFKPFNAWMRLTTWKQILVALVLGASVGLLLGQHVSALKPLGDLFINAIHMIVVPVVFTAIVCAILSVTDARKMQRVTIKALISYVICMAIAAIIGISVTHIIGPGRGFDVFNSVANSHYSNQTHAISSGQMIANFIPDNPFQALVHENILQIVIFALILGVAIKMAGAKAEPVVKLFNAFSHVAFKLAHIVIRFAPYGIFALIAWTFGEFGLQAIWPLLKFVLAVYIGCALQLLLVYSLGLWALGRLRPLTFFKGIAAAMAFAFTTSSSAATLPLSMECAEKNLGVSKSVAQFLLPLGSSFNLNGLSIYLSAAVLFAANLYGIHLTISDYFTIVVTIIFTAMGAAAVPGSALIVMGAIMSAVGIPISAVAFIAGVDRLNDMAQTATNVAGDIFVSTLISKQEKLLDETKWEQDETNVDLAKQKEEII